jgi:hypothetical protein
MKKLLIPFAAAALAGAFVPAQAGNPTLGGTPVVVHKADCDALCQEFLSALYAADDAAEEYAEEMEAGGNRPPVRSNQPHRVPKQETTTP